ncbi:DoxX family protein [Mycobacterium bourgelatii]|uniref:Membrane protein n=1 Tax=Mycobacterium bourgelatii TaxID=1273442 RepID=A0A7I9YLA4_MYCBU|nr:DoxX family protein [Mycobacterium bourgelatii]MCV6978080.1 DoxX family protein [Mycobacterium bourgelatii]GFG89461.1 membrane protein [Mycobacterium bourgelatii]
MASNLGVRLTSYSPVVLSLFRLVYGLLFAGYGSISLFGWPVRTKFFVGFWSWPGTYAGLIEVTTGLLIAAGLFTPVAAFIASGEMAVAYFWMHQPQALIPIADPPQGNGGALAILFCFAFFLLVFTGGGRYSLDAVLRARAAGRMRRT